MSTNQRPLLKVSGTTVGNQYTLEESLNLSDWFSIYTGAPTNGTLEYQAANINGHSAFYRVRLASAPLLVQALMDTNRVGCGLIGTNGGYCEVTAANGTRFTLIVPPNTLPASLVVTMTVITNLAGVPGDGVFPAAVEFGPDGLELMGAAMLDIEFPTNIPINQVASYAFGKNGADFYLTPDLVETNRVQIPITHFSAAGSSQFTKQQLATFTTLSIDNALNQVNHRLASKLAQARQDALNGSENQNVLLVIKDDYISDLKQFLQDNILPHLQEAAQNCALFRKMMPIIWGIDRQYQLMFASADGEPIAELQAAENVWCPGMQNCEQEILNQCEREGGNTGLLTQLLSLERQRQLIGSDSCTPPPDLETRMTNCLPLWTGTFTYNEYGVTNFTIDDCTQDWTFQFHVNGIVTNATEWDVVFFKMVTLYLQADANGDHVLHTVCDSKGSCYPDPGSWSSHSDGVQRTVGACPEAVTVSWTIYPDGHAEDFQITFSEIPAVFYIRGDKKDDYCSGWSHTAHDFFTGALGLGGYSYFPDPGTPAGVTTNSASGTATQSFIDPGGPPTQVTWIWNFKRRQ